MSTLSTQTTIAAPIEFSGNGMHSGRNAKVRLLPADAGDGFQFRRLDAAVTDTLVSADWKHVVRYPACTCIANGSDVQVRTTEHLLAACFATGIDNLTVEIDGEEVPILDGSAEPIVQLIERVGVRDLKVPRKTLEILKRVEYQDEHRRFIFEPADSFEVDINIYPAEYGHLRWHSKMSPDLFRQEIVAAKAWGRLKDVWLPKLVGGFLKRPILRGAGLKTAIVYAFGKPINPAGLKYKDDMVRHKVLDIVGDLQLVGADIKGRVVCHSSAHVTNHSGMKALFADSTAWRYLVSEEGV